MKFVSEIRFSRENKTGCVNKDVLFTSKKIVLYAKNVKSYVKLYDVGAPKTGVFKYSKCY